MNELLEQIILAARRRDTESWMSILVMVVVAVVYGLSTILKAKARKPQDQDEEQSTHPKPGSKLREIAERFQKELSELSRQQGYKPPQRTKGSQQESFQQARRPAGPAAPGPRPYRPGVQQPRPKVAAAPRAVEKFAAQAEQPMRRQTIRPLAEPELSRPSSKVQPDFEELPELSSKAVKGLGAQLGAIPAEMAEVEHLPEILSDYDDPEELRRAILHYEILGRPLSLRDPSGQIIGL